MAVPLKALGLPVNLLLEEAAARQEDAACSARLIPWEKRRLGPLLRCSVDSVGPLGTPSGPRTTPHNPP